MNTKLHEWRNLTRRLSVNAFNVITGFGFNFDNRFGARAKTQPQICRSVRKVRMNCNSI